jgi:glycerate kinase
MRILIAPDKFKGCLNAQEVAQNIATGVRDVLPKARIETVPIADGGEGTAEVICNALGGSWIRCTAHDPIGRAIDCRYTWIEGGLAVMDMSEAAGLSRVSEKERDPLHATTFGVGEMILDAARRGASEIIVGLGGSATNDGGFGMARALGFRFFAESGSQLRTAIGKLAGLKQIEKPTNLSLPSIIGAADVRNPLLGKNGATRVFGPQKGGTTQQLAALERALTKLADVAAKQFGFDYRDRPAAGAAGGLGYGLMTFAQAAMREGFDVVAEAVGLEARIKDADLVITGEGSLDAQTLNGKTPFGVAQLARKHGKRIFAIVGRASEDREVRTLFDGVYPLAIAETTEQQSTARAADLLRKRARELALSSGLRQGLSSRVGGGGFS